MKLKKREITLNEADSVLDMVCIERLLKIEYAAGGENGYRKEVEGELEALKKESADEEEENFTLLQKIRKENF